MASSGIVILFSDTAIQVIGDREIPVELVLRVVSQLTLVEPDRWDKTKSHAFATVPEFGDKVLHVVYNRDANAIKVITAFFDRRRFGTL